MQLIEIVLICWLFYSESEQEADPCKVNLGQFFWRTGYFCQIERDTTHLVGAITTSYRHFIP
jgi:hypothetical protein